MKKREFKKASKDTGMERRYFSYFNCHKYGLYLVKESLLFHFKMRYMYYADVKNE